MKSDLTGERFGRLVAVSRGGRMYGGKTVAWNCRCDCGAATVVGANHLRRGLTRSCGCLKSDEQAARLTTHGLSRTSTYRVWRSMRTRCAYPCSAEAFPSHAGRGIRICARWDDFATFLADMGERPSPKHSIDRIDNDKGYEPGNCRWATQTQQMNNTRRNAFLEYRGERKTVSEWAVAVGLPYSTLQTRIHRGWSVEVALTKPLQPYVRRAA